MNLIEEAILTMKFCPQAVKEGVDGARPPLAP